MKDKAVIGVTGPNEGGDVAWYCTRLMIWLAGGKAVRITPSGAHVKPLDGLVLGGGADIDPARYKQELLRTIQRESRQIRTINLGFIFSILLWVIRRFLSIKSSRSRLDPARDKLEFAMLEHCAQRKIPVLGICRGSQLMNVYWGGSLYQNITNFYTEYPQLRTIRPRKFIDVEDGTVLFGILGRSRATVNSLHDQSVNELGQGLKVSAREKNGIVQALEHPGYPFMVGVQWHPEFMPLHKEQRRVFKQLVRAALVHRDHLG